MVPKQAPGCIQVEQALCVCGECQVLVAWEEFGSCMIDTAVHWVCVLGGRVGFVMKTSYNVVVQHTVSFPTYCTGSDLVDSSAF